MSNLSDLSPLLADHASLAASTVDGSLTPSADAESIFNYADSPPLAVSASDRFLAPFADDRSMAASADDRSVADFVDDAQITPLPFQPAESTSSMVTGQNVTYSFARAPHGGWHISADALDGVLVYDITHIQVFGSPLGPQEYFEIHEGIDGVRPLHRYPGLNSIRELTGIGIYFLVLVNCML